MKAKYKTADGRFEFELEGSTQKEVFKEVASLQEVFEEPCCKLCKKTSTKLVVRKSKDKKGKPLDYFERRCNACGAVLTYGVNIEGGTLFPHRKVKNEKGEEVWDSTNQGWHKYVKQAKA